MVNCQRRRAVPLTWLRRLATRAAAIVGIRQDVVLVVSFIEDRMMTNLHEQFLGRPIPTDVLTFRYPRGPATSHPRHEAVVQGEILISPTAAWRYARRHRLSYRTELARYVVHGLLHWLGHDDRTTVQQRRMRAMEDKVLSRVRHGHPHG
ncbi:MAG TPA: rRNA maturation RNase YbeY [Candidatus Omnitrophica bacterium]|nr:MAG: rRNA maturation RNase YbeY [Omnitrophica WOR_2 bacterium GWF2_63_9]OGX35235.1 MAG: rRNA maturation RNase YbeY [Omnitrophica WOR_2 bacterium RIFCSPHIGHO2_02_FULL_63_39]HBH96347.1 rRNA maturation RNase YbeY [Candidatus Omnitrophota bacterium]